jgi:hypothetical protein
VKPLLAFCGVMTVLIVALLWWQGYFARAGGPTDAQALTMCQRYAAEWHRLPGSAKHSGYADARISKVGDVYTVAGWSDTPVQRYRWTCQTRPVGSDRWELVSIS